MAKEILLVKLGALGDVIRTTPVLRVLEGAITWVTATAAMPLLANNPYITRLLTIEDLGVEAQPRYDLVVNLEDGLGAAKLAGSVGAGKIVGPYVNGVGLTYDASSREWFDMGLSSLYGRQKADELKMRNRKTYQEMMFSALGFTFSGENPILNLPLENTTVPGLIGIEERAGGVWPNKRWNRYPELARRLELSGYRTKVLKQRDSICDYADDINECEFIICGDTLAMHIGLALEKKVVALFICTSPHEIYGYGRLGKVVSPLLDEYFYKRDYSPEPADAISVADVERCLSTVAANTLEPRLKKGNQ